MTIRGARSSWHRPANAVLLEPVEVQVESRVFHLVNTLFVYTSAPSQSHDVYKYKACWLVWALGLNILTSKMPFQSSLGMRLCRVVTGHLCW